PLLQLAQLRRGHPFVRFVQSADRPEQLPGGTDLAELIGQRQVAHVEGMQPEARAAHQDEHHPDDQAEADHELQPDGPTEHDDLLVSGLPVRRRRSMCRPGAAYYITRPAGLKAGLSVVRGPWFAARANWS